MIKSKFFLKFDSSPVLTAAARLRDLTLPEPPQTLVFCPQEALLRHARKRWRGRRVAGFFGETYLLAKTKNWVAVAGRFGVGAPVVGVLLEEFVAWGVKQFVWLGVAGGLQPALQSGDLVLVETAVRDEGTSHHYLPPDQPAAASPKLSEIVETAVCQANLPLKKGVTWTTDAPYRETAVAVAQYQAQGVQTVEMETAALFAVAHYCQTEAAALLAVSDLLVGGVWRPASTPKLAESHLKQALDAIVQGII
ncbi:Uridine phosphorylase [hydrothermal vent metagenome]|uniref:Uridine phosphorylase n=1 Tax=hydrothermal vent metagenome TaxID=652676 RepID=A0A3B0V7I3_9ZZZZ